MYACVGLWDDSACLLTSLRIVRKMEVASAREGIARGTAWWPVGSLSAPHGKSSFWGLHWPLECSQVITSAVFFSRVVTPWIQEPFSNLFYRGIPTQNEGQGDSAVSFQGSSSQARLAWVWGWRRPKVGRRPNVFEWAHSAWESRVTSCNWLRTDDLFYSFLSDGRFG